MLSRTAQYVLKTLGYLVRTRGQRTPGEEIARQTGIPSNYLSKILNLLRKHGYVDAEKGWGGGFQLRPSALRRPIRELLKLIDGAEKADRKDCLLGLSKCDPDRPCPLHPYWERIRAIHSEMISATRVADLGR